MPKLRSPSANSCRRSRRQFFGPRECFAAECWVLEHKSGTTPESRDEVAGERVPATIAGARDLRQIAFEFVDGFEEAALQGSFGDIQPITSDLLGVDFGRKSQGVGISDDVDKNRTLVTKRGAKRVLQVVAVFHAKSANAQGFCQFGEISGLEVDAKIFETGHAHFELDHSEGAVV